MSNSYHSQATTAILLLACLVLAACGDRDKIEASFATITGVEPIEEKILTPREVCEDVSVTRQAPVKDEHQITGMATGAVVGGALGNQVGGGKGKTLATAAGAVAGGYAGKKVQEDIQTKNTETATERKCTTVSDESMEVTGYRVNYELDGKAGSVRMDQPPQGTRIPVVNGQLVLQSVGVEQ